MTEGKKSGYKIFYRKCGYEAFYRKFDKDLGEIRRKTLLGDFWGKGGAISYQRQIIVKSREYEKRCNDESKFSVPAELFSISSSTYYAASDNAASWTKKATLFCKPLWFWRAWRCLRKAEKYSDEFAKLKPMKDMSLGELDVRACVLNKAGRRSEAANLLSHGIMRILTKQIGTKHDSCLFLIHEAEVITGMRRYDKENKAETNYQQAMKLLEEDEAIPVLTKVRVMKSYGEFLIKSSRFYEARNLLNKAYFLAEEKGLIDQTVKIKALIDVCR